MDHISGVQVRSLQPGEVAQAECFLAEKVGTVSGTMFLFHFAETVFVAYRDSEWLGLAVTFRSPSNVGTAVIDQVVVANEDNLETAGLLIKHVEDFYREECIFRLMASPGNSGLSEKYALENNWRLDENGYFRKKLAPEKICLHNRRMRPKMNTINGEISDDTLFEYFQQDNMVWGTYSGGTIQRGVLVGRMIRNGDINFNYVQINNDGEVNTGTSHASTEFMNDGRIILYEDWQWTGNRTGGGRSVIEEVRE